MSYRFSLFLQRLPGLTRSSPRLLGSLPVRLCAPLLLSLLAGCSSFEFPWVYKLSIDQGNIITQEMVDKLQPGMSRNQVQFVMGSPLVADPFHEDRWDYIYTLLDSKGKRTEQHLTVFFTDDKLSGLSGNVVPQGDEPAPQAAVAPETTAEPAVR